MKYTCTIEINLPIDKTVALWENEAYFKEWQDGFESIELLSGSKNTEGAKSKIILQDKRRIELIETIISYDLPNEKVALYKHIHMTNTQTSRFVAINDSTTQYISVFEYTIFSGFFIKLIAKLFPSKFKEQSQKWMNQFKAFADSKA
jgi:uncharacterized membrane protein